MHVERQRLVSGIFAAALERSSQERPEYLEAACGGDAGLRCEVESLLIAHDREETSAETTGPLFLAPPGAAHAAAAADRGEAALAPGSSLGPYELVALLGSGGMGQVYRARDPRLRREVAIKVLSRHWLADAAQRRRFEREARAAGALNHPNILAVFDVGIEGATPYLVTELLVGETLEARLRGGPLPLRECLEMARQVAAGLAAAHDKGIVHRDLKPANLFLTRDGRVKIVDFGLAKQAASTEDGTLATLATQPGTVLGTVGYMSPEQLRCQPVDHRSDLFAFGAVLYEMLAGRRAFARASPAETISAILTQEPPARPAARQVPWSVEQLLRRCLRKDRAERPRRSRELCAALDQLMHVLEGAGLAEATAAAGAAPAPALETGHAIAVLPFANLTGDPDQDYFCEGMADELIGALARLEDLRVAPRLAISRMRGGSVDALRRLGAKLRVDKLLQGSVRKAGARLRITVQLVNVADGYHVWSERYDREMADLLVLQDEIALRVVEAMRLRLGAPRPMEPAAPAAPRHGGDLEAYHLCLRGRYHRSKGMVAGLRESLRCFADAVEKAPDYALAHAGLADCYLAMGFSNFAVMHPHQAMPRAKAAARKALELDPGLADAYACLGYAKACYDWDWAGAEADFQRAVDLGPGHATTHLLHSVFLLSQRRFDAAVAAARRAWELEPLSPTINGFQVFAAGLANHSVEEAIEELRQLAATVPGFAVGHVNLGISYVETGRYREAIAELRPFVEQGDTGPIPQTYIACALAGAGEHEAARQALAELHAARRQRYVPAYPLALAHIALGESEEAFAWLDRAAAERDNWPLILPSDPMLDPLRGDPRFDALLRRMGLSAPGGPAESGGSDRSAP